MQDLAWVPKLLLGEESFWPFSYLRQIFLDRFPIQGFDHLDQLFPKFGCASVQVNIKPSWSTLRHWFFFVAAFNPALLLDNTASPISAQDKNPGNAEQDKNRDKGGRFQCP